MCQRRRGIRNSFDVRAPDVNVIVAARASCRSQVNFPSPPTRTARPITAPRSAPKSSLGLNASTRMPVTDPVTTTLPLPDLPPVIVMTPEGTMISLLGADTGPQPAPLSAVTVKE